MLNRESRLHLPVRVGNHTNVRGRQGPCILWMVLRAYVIVSDMGEYHSTTSQSTSKRVTLALTLPLFLASFALLAACSLAPDESIIPRRTSPTAVGTLAPIIIDEGGNSTPEPTGPGGLEPPPRRTPTKLPTKTATPRPTRTPRSTSTPTLSPTPAGSPVPTRTPTRTLTPFPTPTPFATRTPLSGPATVTPRPLPPTVTPRPTRTLTATPTITATPTTTPVIPVEPTLPAVPTETPFVIVIPLPTDTPQIAPPPTPAPGGGRALRASNINQGLR